MAISVSFNGVQVKKPGYWGKSYSKEELLQMRVTNLLFMLGVRWNR